MARWKIEYYLTSFSKSPVEKFIEGLTPASQAKVANTFDLLAEFGLQIGLPHAKKVIGTPLWELRVLGEQSLRFFYIAKVGQTFLILHAFTKKKQKTPEKEIKTALGRLKSILDK
jgi:phage-related protein